MITRDQAATLSAAVSEYALASAALGEIREKHAAAHMLPSVNETATALLHAELSAARDRRQTAWVAWVNALRAVTDGSVTETAGHRLFPDL